MKKLISSIVFLLCILSFQASFAQKNDSIRTNNKNKDKDKKDNIITTFEVIGERDTIFHYQNAPFSYHPDTDDYAILKDKKDKTANDIKKFQDDLLVLVNRLCTVNGGINSIEDIKKIPEIAAEMEKGSDIAKVLDVLSAMVNFGQMDKKEETKAVKALETDEDRMLREAREEAAKNNVEL